ncbi:MAG: septum formation protein Maf [Deltaproteobacteria bacterium]|nr:septum formation protein Maf [Deltaproteobacteria bacterium]
MTEHALFILASESPRRPELLRRMRLTFDVRPARCDERLHQGETPEAYTRRMALEKAEAVGAGAPDTWVLAADTVVFSDGRILGKPGDRDEARLMLSALSGRVHEVVTSFCWYHGGRNIRYVRSIESRVEFKDLTEDEIERYVGSGEPMDKAGAYAVQGLGSFMVRAVHGSYTRPKLCKPG